MLLNLILNFVTLNLNCLWKKYKWGKEIWFVGCWISDVMIWKEGRQDKDRGCGCKFLNIMFTFQREMQKDNHGSYWLVLFQIQTFLWQYLCCFDFSFKSFGCNFCSAFDVGSFKNMLRQSTISQSTHVEWFVQLIKLLIISDIFSEFNLESSNQFSN